MSRKIKSTANVSDIIMDDEYEQSLQLFKERSEYEKPTTKLLVDGMDRILRLLSTTKRLYAKDDYGDLKQRLIQHMESLELKNTLQEMNQSLILSQNSTNARLRKMEKRIKQFMKNYVVPKLTPCSTTHQESSSSAFHPMSAPNIAPQEASSQQFGLVP